MERVRGKVAIANAKLAYQRGKALFAGPRWERLADKGAVAQRLLWASTGTKNQAYSDVLYVEELIGRDTVNTMPPATMDAFRDHGRVVADTIEADVDGARADAGTCWTGWASRSTRSAAELVVDGVKQFSDAADTLLAAVERKRDRGLGRGGAPGLVDQPGALGGGGSRRNDGMQLGVVGLGRMGGNIVRRLQLHGHACVVYDAKPEAVQQLAAEGAIGADGLDDLVAKLAPRRARCG